MTRHSIIDRQKISDKLIDVVDGVRRKVHTALGTRTYRVQIVSRRWSGGSVGQGTPHVKILEIDPRPRVTRSEGNRLAPGGQENQGTASVDQISLRYSAEELQPPEEPGLEVAWRVVDTGGQRQADQWYLLSADPVTRRGDLQEDSTDWRVVLKQTSPMTDFDGGN
jgi:hypothetical protein